MKFVFPISSFLTIMSILLLFFLNPGIIYSDLKNKEKVYCDICKFYYPMSNKKMEHCGVCGICVTNLDHHCDVIGKCVGKYNTCFFILFTFSIFIFFISSFIIFVSFYIE